MLGTVDPRLFILPCLLLAVWVRWLARETYHAYQSLWARLVVFTMVLLVATVGGVVVAAAVQSLST